MSRCPTCKQELPYEAAAHEKRRAGWDALVERLGSDEAARAHMGRISKGRNPRPRFQPRDRQEMAGQPAGVGVTTKSAPAGKARAVSSPKGESNG